MLEECLAISLEFYYWYLDFCVYLTNKYVNIFRTPVPIFCLHSKQIIAQFFVDNTSTVIIHYYADIRYWLSIASFVSQGLWSFLFCFACSTSVRHVPIEKGGDLAHPYVKSPYTDKTKSNLQHKNALKTSITQRLQTYLERSAGQLMWLNGLLDLNLPTNHKAVHSKWHTFQFVNNTPYKDQKQ